ncbi:hypothetical protein FUAX_39160 (plasmid) [Fulvitalea axinellae]|uniref:DUF3570 domain-containing protein n=1 Tax=Fulvitalea axinellae TaxID=1182444 RepID=A0AAU9CYA5_9BACT|nr:hypothetical protein FUAX_39160 [Fulvitalea axinellae]
MRRYILIVSCLLIPYFSQGQNLSKSDSSKVYKKRVLESTEIDILNSYYQQEGNNAAVTGGIGDEKITNFTPTIVVSVPLNDDDVLTFDVGISAYSSASSSNLNPFDLTSASGDDDDDDYGPGKDIMGSPWLASSGASGSDAWKGLSVDYSHSSDDRNRVWNINGSVSGEYDYTSFGLGGGYLMLFNRKNTEVGVNASVFMDTWSPMYPTELKSFDEVEGNLNSGFFNNVAILDQNGKATEKLGTTWSPVQGFGLIDDKGRNTYSFSISFSQILSVNAQFSVFMDLVWQNGWLANPMQRVYFADRPNYYIGNASAIPNYTSPTNKEVFQLADDIERLPDKRFKVPVGARFNYFINEILTLRTYYRYYYDDWGVNSNTVSIETPIKVSSRFTLYPSFRYYTQTEADYFAPFEAHLSSSDYYTSDYDLSDFSSSQYGFGISYTDIFTKFRISRFGMKSVDLKYNYYKRSTGLSANYVGLGLKFVMQE